MTYFAKHWKDLDIGAVLGCEERLKENRAIIDTPELLATNAQQTIPAASPNEESSYVTYDFQIPH
jgi:hypothetical protein